MSNSFIKNSVIIKKSSIPGAGMGVFASKNIKKDSIITEYKGKIYKNSNEQKLKNINKIELDEYTLNLGNGKSIIGDKNCRNVNSCAQLINDRAILDNPQKLIYENANKYIKSIENVNCEFVTISGKTYAKAVKDIKKGEELFIHYGYNYWFRPKYKKSVTLSKLKNDKLKRDFIVHMDQKYMNSIFDTI